jgi:hypothetical protein
MITALEGGERSASPPRPLLTPRKNRYPLYRRLGGLQGRSGQLRKILSPPEFDPRTVQPVAQSLYRLSYPAHEKVWVAYGNEGTNVCSTILVLTSKLSFRSVVSNTVDYKRVKSFPWLPRFVLAMVNNAAEISERYRSVFWIMLQLVVESVDAGIMIQWLINNGDMHVSEIHLSLPLCHSHLLQAIDGTWH